MINEPLYTKLDITNTSVLSILDKTAELGLFTEDSKSIQKYQSDDYERDAITYTSKHYLETLDPTNYIKYKINGFAGTTPGAQYFIKAFEEITGTQLGDGSQPIGQGGFRSTVYNPNGFLGWHKDGGYGVYSILFSYCAEKPDGFYRWQDALTKEIHTQFDVPGWSAKSFVSLDDENSEWHTVKTTTPKCGLGLSFVDYNEFLNVKNLIQS
jgi:hypothetical protein